MKSTIPLIMFSACILSLATMNACSSRSSTESSSGGTASATVQVNPAQADSLPASDIANGAFQDIVSIKVDVWNGSSPLISGQALEYQNGGWRGTLNNLPVGPVLAFAGRAFNSRSVKIFSGAIATALTGSNDALSIALSPIPAENGVALPRIEEIIRPARIVASSTVSVSAALKGTTGDSLAYAITAENGGGSFSPSDGAIILTSGTGTIVVSYTAPDVIGTYHHSIRVANSEESRVATNFTTSVVASAPTDGLSAGVSPVIHAISGVRTGSQIVLTADVGDQGPVDELTYQWGIDNGLAFADTTTNPAILQGYDETKYGAIALRVKNSAGGEASAEFHLASGMFPDTNTAPLPSAPSHLKAIPKSGQATLTWTAVTGAASYNLYYSTTAAVSKTTGTAITGITSPYVHTGLTANTTYSYVVTALNLAGESIESNVATVLIQPPNSPTGITVESSNGAITLSWDGVADANKYLVYISEATDGLFLLAGETSSRSYRVERLTNGKTYYFALKSSNSAGDSLFSEKKSAIPNAVIISPYVSKSACYRGELHDHTTKSDGTHAPDQVAVAYKNAGYDFLAITDHDHVTTLSTDAGLLMINGVEETANEGHIITLNTPSQLAGQDGQTIINYARDNGGVAILAHPNYTGAGYTLDELNTLTGYTAIEIYNRVSDFEESHGNAEAKWDALLSTGKIVYGVAVDDMHSMEKRFNWGWVMVFSDNLTAREIVANIKAGNYYSSMGPQMSVTVEGNTIYIATDSDSTIEFVAKEGITRQMNQTAVSSSYTVLGDEGYVRIRITRKADGKKAWSNPIFVK